MLTFSTAQTSWLLFASAIFLGIEGIQFVLSNLQLGNLVVEFRSVCITLISGSHDSSSLTFLLVKIIYDGGGDF